MFFLIFEFSAMRIIEDCKVTYCCTSSFDVVFLYFDVYKIRSQPGDFVVRIFYGQEGRVL